MKLVGFSIKNYRSISTAYKLPVTNYSVLVGPNNEGKSNILKGLGLALALLSGNKLGRHAKYSMRKLFERFEYDWERDFPVGLQESDPDGRSEFTCEFELEGDEFTEFRARTKFNLKKTLKARVLIGNDDVKFDFLMPGKGKQSLNTKRAEISTFITEKLFLQHIPAIRTSQLAVTIIESLLEVELSKLEDKPEFKSIITAVEKLQQPIIQQIEKSLLERISSFVPDVKGITIKNSENVSRLISASCDVYIDDGTETKLATKEAGVISLTAISLLQHFSKAGSLNKGLILLLEEPECHLHPRAVHNLRKALGEISGKYQVIVTTHSPIIVQREHVGQNIIVQNGKASPAANIKEIRQSLGITMSDNLSSAYLMLLVEGEEDGALIRAWLGEKSPRIKKAFHNAVLAIDHLGGATNLSYKASLYKNNLCHVIGFLDNDQAGRRGVTDALDKNIIRPADYCLASSPGMPNSEIEDLLDLSVYRDLIKLLYGVDLKTKAFRTGKEKAVVRPG